MKVQFHYYLKLVIGDKMESKQLKRIDANKNIMKYITNEIVVANIGVPSKELYEVKDRAKNFYMIGSMGLVSSIGLGLSLSQDEKVIVIDGDGSLLMNMGSLVTVAKNNPKNLIWIVINNGAYGSTGNQTTYANDLNLVEIAKTCGFKNSYKFSEIEFSEILKKDEGSFIEYNVETGNSDAGIIPLSPIEIRDRFMEAIK